MSGAVNGLSFLSASLNLVGLSESEAKRLCNLKDLLLPRGHELAGEGPRHIYKGYCLERPEAGKACSMGLAVHLGLLDPLPALSTHMSSLPVLGQGCGWSAL